MASLSPSPLEGNPRPFELVEAGETKEWFPNSKPDSTLVGHVFKVTTDQFVGKVAMIRIHQGTFKAGTSVQLGDNRKPLRIAHIHKVHGKGMEEVEVAVPGDIIAVSKVDELVYNSVIHESQNDHLETLRFKSLPMPRPMYGLAIEAKSHGDETKISGALHKLVEEDPTFQVERIAATKQTVARALGELHMRVILEKLHNRFKLDLNTAPPRVAYKETITGKADGHHRHKKQTGGAGQFGEVFLKVEPMTQEEVAEKGDKLDFLDETVGGSIPRQFLPAIEKGVRQAMDHGVVAGYPMEGVRVRVYDGKHHPVDSKEVAFIAAGKRAFMDAVRKANPVLLEPFCDVEVSAPSSAMGDITANLSTKRGQVGETDYLPGETVIIHAKVPLSEMGRYSSELKSVTGGQGSFVMDYSHDEPTPGNVQADIIAAYQPQEED
jgi:elongation factor G